MKKMILLLLLFITVTASSQAAGTISANFTNDKYGNLAGTVSDGLSGYAATNWNNLSTAGNWYSPNSGAGVGLVDNTGDGSAGVTVSYGPAWMWEDSTAPSVSVAATYLNHYTSAIPTITVEGIPYSVYTVIVYHGSEIENGHEAAAFVPVTVNGQLQEGCTDSGVWSTVGGWVDGRNCRVVTGLTGATMTIEIAPSTTSQADSTIAGFQIVEVLPTYAHNPTPYDGQGVTDASAVAVTTDLSWSAPTTYTGATYDVYFGTTEPNLAISAPYGLTQIGTAGQSATSATPDPSPMVNDTQYWWVVDAYEPNALNPPDGDLHPGSAWSFTTIVATPVIDTEPQSQTAASADLLIEVSNPEVYTWYQVGTSSDTVVQTTGTLGTPGAASDTYTTGVEGDYYCVVSNTAGTDTSQTVRVMNPRLVGHWTLDKSLESPLANSSVDGTVWDGVYIDPNELAVQPVAGDVVYVEGADGIADHAVEFDGNLMVEIPDSNEFFNFHPQGLTLTAWIYENGDTNYPGWYSRMVTLDGAYGISNGATHYGIGCIVQNSGWQDIVPAIEARGQWRFVAVTYDPNDVDPGNGEQITYGVYDDTDVVDILHTIVLDRSVPGLDTDLDLAIGGRREGGNNHHGAIDDVRVYNYALTPTELQQLYSAMSGNALCMNINDPALVYDFNGDCKVALEDFADFVKAWLNSNIVLPTP